MAGTYEETGGAGRGITVLSITATVAVGASLPTTMEEITINNDAGPVAAVPQTVVVSGTDGIITSTTVAVAANAHAVIITPPALNTVQLWIGNTALDTGALGVPTEGIKMSLLKPFLYVFDRGAVATIYLKSTGKAGGNIDVNLTWL